MGNECCVARLDLFCFCRNRRTTSGHKWSVYLSDLPNHEIQSKLSELQGRIAALEFQSPPERHSQNIPNPPFSGPPPEAPFMAFSTCSASDFLHPRFQEICGLIRHPFLWQRKLWEWTFVIHHLLESGVVKPGSRGLVFGVGNERLPALFAGMGASIVATDAPVDVSEKWGWNASGQHATALNEMRYPEIVDGSVFDANVTFQTCDMNNIHPELHGFDFNWSSCCFEHLGDLEAGIQFVINAVEKTLRVGGVAVHTTEFNLSSNDKTVESGVVSIYRRRDLEDLAERLRSRGHTVKPFIVAPNSYYWDFHVDLPPYKANPHLKLVLSEYVATSAGIVVRRGR